MPLAHILAPQLFQKAQQIEADLGHAPVMPQGYLAANPSVDALKAQLQTQRKAAKSVAQGDGQGGISYDKRAKKLGFNGKPEDFDPRIQGPLYNYQNAAGALPIPQRGRLAAAGMLPVPSVADMQRYEQGTAIAAPVDVKPYKKGTPLTFAPGDVTDEAGFALGLKGKDKGKRLGYLDQEAANPGIRYLDRRPSDIGLTGGENAHGVRPSFGQDADAQRMLETMYGRYLKDYTGNNNKFFNEMFYKPQTVDEVKRGVKPQKMSPKEIENAKQGVKVLMELQRGDKT